MRLLEHISIAETIRRLREARQFLIIASMRRKILKAIRWTALIAGALVAVAAALILAFFTHFYPSPPKAGYPHPADALAGQRQDLDYFAGLIAQDRAFSAPAREEASRRLAALNALPMPLDHAHLRVALMQIVALADNGHSRLGFDPAAAPKELPVRVLAFPDGLYVMRAAGAPELLGGRLVEIDGMPIDEVMRRLEALRGGTPQWRRAYASLYLYYQDFLYGTDIAQDPDKSTWTVESPSGARVTRTLEAKEQPESAPYAYVKRWLSSEPFAGMTEGWQVFQADSGLPLSLQDFDIAFRRRRLANSCVMFLQYKSNDDEGSQSIRAFSAETAADMRGRPPCQLIMDLRYDDGGNYLKTAGFMRSLSELIAPNGRIFLLLGPATFSAGIVSAAFIKQAGGDRVVILGEPVGDRLQFLSEGNRGCLPNYLLCVSYATGKHDYQHPCHDLKVCFWPNYLYPTRVRSLDPDETIPLTFAQWRAGRDPVFERALSLASVGGNR
jgi:hypothetical protein